MIYKYADLAVWADLLSGRDLNEFTACKLRCEPAPITGRYQWTARQHVRSQTAYHTASYNWNIDALDDVIKVENSVYSSL